MLMKTGILHCTTCFHGFGILRQCGPFCKDATHLCNAKLKIQLLPNSSTNGTPREHTLGIQLYIRSQLNTCIISNPARHVYFYVITFTLIPMTRVICDKSVNVPQILIIAVMIQGETKYSLLTNNVIKGHNLDLYWYSSSSVI